MHIIIASLFSITNSQHILSGPKRQQNNRRPALEDLTQNGPEVKKKKQQSRRCKTITSILGTPISSLVQNQLTTLSHTDCTNSSQLISESLCTNALLGITVLPSFIDGAISFKLRSFNLLFYN